MRLDLQDPLWLTPLKGQLKVIHPIYDKKGLDSSEDWKAGTDAYGIERIESLRTADKGPKERGFPQSEAISQAIRHEYSEDFYHFDSLEC